MLNSFPGEPFQSIFFDLSQKLTKEISQKLILKRNNSLKTTEDAENTEDRERAQFFRVLPRFLWL
jgi:Tfp pilus assembly ATPase PilU